MSKVTIDTSITINVEQTDGITAVLTLTLEEARALKDELIRAVGAQNPITHPIGVRGDTYAPVITPRGGFINTDATQQRRIEPVVRNIPQHLLDRAESARQKVAQPDTRGGGVLHPADRLKCQCGEPGWGQNGCCGTSGCNSVPA